MGLEKLTNQMLSTWCSIFPDLNQDSHVESYVVEEVKNFIKYFQKHIHEQVLKILVV
jgi:hypothetical protein